MISTSLPHRGDRPLDLRGSDYHSMMSTCLCRAYFVPDGGTDEERFHCLFVYGIG